MYGKLFEQMYDGSLRADWRAMVVFQQFIILSDQDGVVDMTLLAIQSRTGLPMDIIEHGISVLSAPDPDSRTPDEEGRRIVLLDDHRSWGWRIVNHAHYRDKGSAEERREKAADRKRRQREKSATAGAEKRSHAMSRLSRHTDTDTDTDTRGAAAPLPEGLNQDAWTEWLAYRKANRWKAYTTNRTAEKLAKLPLDKQLECVHYSIDQGYQGLFPERMQRQGDAPKPITERETYKAALINRGEPVMNHESKETLRERCEALGLL